MCKKWPRATDLLNILKKQTRQNNENPNAHVVTLIEIQTQSLTANIEKTLLA